MLRRLAFILCGLCLPLTAEAQEAEEAEEVSWERNIEIGGDVALIARPFQAYEPTVGWGVHVHWQVLDWLRIHPYFLDAHHDLAIAQESTVSSFVFGAKIAPTLLLSKYARGWVVGGVGWGRVAFEPMVITDPNGQAFDVRERDGTFVEFPFGVGLAYEVWPDWLTIEYEGTIAPIVGQSGTAHEQVQAVDQNGNLRNVEGFAPFEASFVQTFGLSLLL